MKRISTLLFCMLTLGFCAVAQTRIYVNEYLNIGVGARGLGMAGAQSATVGDVTAGYWNPAGMTQVKNDFEVGLMHAEYFSGNAKYDYAAGVMPLKDSNHVVGLSILRFAIDDIPNTIDYVQPDGSFDESKLKSMTAGDYAFLFSYAQRLRLFKNESIRTNIGANVKVIYRQLGSLAHAWGAGVDVGIQGSYRQWRFGIMAKDITTTYTAWSFHLSDHDKIVFGNTGNEIPVKSYEVMLPRFNFGFGRYFMKPEKKMQVMAELDVDLTTDGMRNTVINSKYASLDPHMGIEASYKNTIFLRLGVGNIQRVLDDRDTTNKKKYTIYQPSAGLGVKIKGLMIDYAFTSLQAQASPLYTHIISLRLDVNRKKNKQYWGQAVEEGAPGEEHRGKKEKKKKDEKSN